MKHEDRLLAAACFDSFGERAFPNKVDLTAILAGDVANCFVRSRAKTWVVRASVFTELRQGVGPLFDEGRDGLAGDFRICRGKRGFLCVHTDCKKERERQKSVHIRVNAIMLVHSG